MDKKERVRAFFGAHAAAYSTSPGHRSGHDLERLVALLAPAGTETALDVATAAGHTAFALAPLVAAVTGVDMTPEMGAEFAAQATQRGVRNARFVPADAEALPFADATFDLVTCRRAAHHFPDPGAALAEMARVLRPGGKLGIADMAAPDDPAAAMLLNRMELARDPSHCRALGPAEWAAAMGAAGLLVQALEIQPDDTDFDKWLYPVAPAGREAAAAAALVRAAPPATGAQVVYCRPDGGLVFRKRRIILLAVRP